MICTCSKIFPRRGLIVSRFNCLSIGRYAGTWKKHEADAVKPKERFKPRSLNTPMTFKEWKKHGPRLYEKRLSFLMKAGNVSILISQVYYAEAPLYNLWFSQGKL